MIYAYIRVSTHKQTTENQRLEIDQFCTKRDDNGNERRFASTIGLRYAKNAIGRYPHLLGIVAPRTIDFHDHELAL